MTLTKNQKAIARAEATLLLRTIAPVETTLYTNLTHVSQSGMSRSIQVFLPREDGTWREITPLVAAIIDCPIDHKHGGLKIGGVGMDMGFAVVYDCAYWTWKGTPEHAMYGVTHPRVTLVWPDTDDPDAKPTKKIEPIGDAGYMYSHKWR